MTGNAASKNLVAAIGAVVFASFAGTASASPIIFERQLPTTTDINAAAGASRDNVDWLSGFNALGTYDIVGDDFSITGGGTLNTLTVYEVANNTTTVNGTGPANSTPQNEFTSLSLYVGAQGGPLSLVTSSYTSQEVYYGTTAGGVSSPGTNYQSGSGVYYPIYAITFTFPSSYTIGSGLYGFAVDAGLNTSNAAYIANCGASPTVGCYGLFLAASNAGLSSATGAIEQGADDSFIYYYENSQGVPPVLFGALCDSAPGQCGGWDKGSDLNVQITGAANLPEPSTFGFVTIAILGAALTRRRLRNQASFIS
jgi:hypothetical protein